MSSRSSRRAKRTNAADSPKNFRNSPTRCRRFPPLDQRPLRRIRRQKITLTTLVGDVPLEIPYGEDSATGIWHSPVRQAWGLSSRQRLTPELQQRLCATAAATFSYERAAEVARCWSPSLALDDSLIHRHVQRAGDRALAEEAGRVRSMETPLYREEAIARAGKKRPAGSFSLLLMLDGWMARERGPAWGLDGKSEAGSEHVRWREMKTAIVLRAEDRAETAGGRPFVVEKAVVAHEGEWDGLAGKLHAEALRRGLRQAREVFVVADGGLWIWNLVEERFGTATQVLDFYHASQHLWAMAHALYGETGEEAGKWVAPLLHQLRHGEEAGALRTLGDLSRLLGELDEEDREEVERGQKYFETHRERVRYASVSARGCPVGSGAMESTCAQLQGRFKRTGQFWTEAGKQRLLAVELARRNGDWPDIWKSVPEE